MEPPGKLFFQHYTIQVTDLKTSLDFYINIMGFEPIDRPSFDFPGAWVGVGKHIQLHLIEVKFLPPFTSGSRALHFAFQTDNLVFWETELTRKGITIRKVNLRPDGVKQLFVQDPDGYFIEICDGV